MIDTGYLDLAPVTSIDENAIDSIGDYVEYLLHAFEKPLVNGQFEPLQKRLMAKVEKASTKERIRYLLQDAKMGNEQLEALKKNVIDVQNGTPSKYVSVKNVQKRIKNGLTADKIASHQKWLKTTYIPAMKDKLKTVNETVEHIDESVSERHVFYRLSESEMFKTANRMAKINGEEVVNVIPRMVVAGEGFTQLSLNDFDPSVIYELFESNRFKITCKKDMKRLLQSGDVVMCYGDEWRLPTCIPYVVKAMPHNQVAIYVNVTPFCSIDQYGKLRVTQIRNYSGLMSILFAACVAHAIARGNMTLPADMADGLVLMYAGMMTKVINSLVHADSVQKETCKYLCAEFALVQMYGTEFGTTTFQRYKNKYFPKLGNLVVNSIDDTFHIDSFDNLTEFVEELKRVYPIMKSLTVGAISEKWMRSFGSATALSLDYLGYHIYTMCMLLFESPLISRMALEPMVDQKRGTDAFKRMQSMIENDK